MEPHNKIQKEYYINSSDVAGFIGMTPKEWGQDYQDKVAAYNKKFTAKEYSKLKVSKDMADYINYHKNKEDPIEKNDIENLLKENSKLQVEKQTINLLRSDKTDKTDNISPIPLVPALIDIPLGTKSQYTDYIIKTIRMERGNVQENIILQKLSNDLKQNIDTFQKIRYGYITKRNIKIKIGARPDGIIRLPSRVDPKQPQFLIPSEIILVEAKNRVSKLLIPIPDYEKVQVTLYLKIFRAQKCLLIQKFREEYHITEIVLDNTFFNEIQQRLLQSFENF